MKVFFAYTFQDGPWGGGNQFLKALAGYFRSHGGFAETPADADAILFNSHQNIRDVIDLRLRYPAVPIIHRVDGPVHLIRGFDREVDTCIARANAVLADATIYQSRWSRDRCREVGLKARELEDVITNAPDPSIFGPDSLPTLAPNERIRVIATSWSGNPHKGFDVYRWMDCNLKPEKVQMTFVGNSPVEFTTITRKPPMASADLAKELRRHHLYVTASRNDPCSNALIEALHCGLPALAVNDGGHPEIVGPRGLLFASVQDIPALLECLASGYRTYQNAPRLPTLSEVGKAYKNFIELVRASYTPGVVDPDALRALEQMLPDKSRKTVPSRFERIGGWLKKIRMRKPF